jgi:hypothetical protein
MLVMPHICAIPEDETGDFRESVRAMMTNFHARGFEDNDVVWRNICYYEDKDLINSPVLFGLERVSAGFDSAVWVDKDMVRLFV